MAGLLVQSFLFIEQPALFSIVLFAATLAIEEAAWERSADPPRLGPALGAWVALNFAWTWLHRFSVLGHAMIFAWAALPSPQTERTRAYSPLACAAAFR